MGFITMTTTSGEDKSLTACETSIGNGSDFEFESGEFEDLVVKRVYSECGYGSGLSLVNPLSEDEEEPVSDDPVRDSISLIFQEIGDLRARLANQEERDREKTARIDELEGTVAEQDELITKLVGFVFWRDGARCVGDFEGLYYLSEYYKAHPEELEDRSKLVKRVEKGRKELKSSPNSVTWREVNAALKEIRDLDDSARRRRMFPCEGEGKVTLGSRHPTAIFGRDSPLMCEIKESLDRKDRRERALMRLERPNSPSTVTDERMDRIFSMLAALLKNNNASEFLAFSVIRRELDIGTKAMTRLSKHIEKDSRFMIVESGVPRAGRRVKMVGLSDEGKRRVNRSS